MEFHFWSGKSENLRNSSQENVREVFLFFFNIYIYIIYIYIYTKILEVNLFAFANANKLTSRIFVYKSSPLSTLPLVIPEYI